MENTGFLIKEGINPSEYDPYVNFAELSGEFNPKMQYGAYCTLTGDKFYDRNKVLNLLIAIWDYIPFEYLSQVKFICHPSSVVSSSVKEVESKLPVTFSWKYMPLK